MINRRIAINLGAFLIVAVLLVLYGIVDLFGNPVEKHRTASATFPSANGLHEHFLVSLDGVPVGEVTKLRLQRGGVKVTMSFDKGARIPADVRARIIRSSAVGEQRIDLSPHDGGAAPQLPDGAVIPVARTDAVPPSVGDVLNQVNALLRSLPSKELNSVVHEAAVGFAGRADDMKSIIDSLTTLSNAYLQHQSSFRQLLDTSPKLLDALSSSAADLQSGLRRTKALTQLLVNRRFDLVKLLEDLTTFGTVGNDFVLTNRTNLTCILSDAADVNEFLQGANLQNLSTALRLNQQFFGTVDKISPQGFAKDLGLNAPTRDTQTWLRVRTLIPPAQPPASQYTVPYSTPPTKPGAACRNVYGNGAGPVTQGASYKPLYGGKLIPPTAADAEAPKTSLTGPAAATHPAPAALSTPPAPPAQGGGMATVLTALAGMVLLGLLLVAVPHSRYRRSE